MIEKEETTEEKMKEQRSEELIPMEFEAMIQEAEVDGSIDQVVANLEKAVQAYNRLKAVALRLTRPEDWADIGGHPYLLESGAQKVARAFGVQIGKVRVESEWQEDSKGKYQIFVARGSAYSRKLNAYIEDIGVCSTRDRFFAIRGGELVPIEEVDITSVMKKAVANLYGRLIKRVVGLMGVSWDDLRAAGLKPAVKVEYKTQAKTPEKEAREKLENLLMRLADDEEKRKQLLEKYSTWIDSQGRERRASDISQMSDSWVRATYGRITKEFGLEQKGGAK